MKGKIIILIIILVFVFGMASMALGKENIKIIVNGTVVNSEISVQIINGRVIVPLRIISEFLGANVKWDEFNKTVNIDSQMNHYRFLKLNGNRTTWPYWIENGEVYMEASQYVDLMRRYYNNLHSPISYSPGLIIKGNKTFRFEPIKRDGFDTVSIEMLYKRGDFIPFIWDAKEGNLIIKGELH